MSDYRTDTGNGGTWLLVGGGAILLVVLFALFSGGGGTTITDSSAIPELGAVAPDPAPAIPADAQ